MKSPGRGSLGSTRRDALLAVGAIAVSGAGGFRRGAAVAGAPLSPLMQDASRRAARRENDPALMAAAQAMLALRLIARHDRAARAAESALAKWARASDVSLLIATRSRHPKALALRHHLRQARRRRRDVRRTIDRLVVTAARTSRGARAKLRVALLIEREGDIQRLIRSASRDLRQRRCAT